MGTSSAAAPAMNPGRFESISPPNEFTSSAAAPATDPPSWPLASSAADSHWLQPARRRGAAAPPGLCVGAARSVSAEEDGDEQRGREIGSRIWATRGTGRRYLFIFVVERRGNRDERMDRGGD